MIKLKYFLTIICIFASLSLSAKHLEFMGIPISGTINSFQAKLQAKGCSLASNNKDLPTGIRGFTGVFAGKDCDIIVWYNHKTKIVYQVRAVVDCGSSLDNAHNTFLYYKNLLNQKYKEIALTSDMLEDSSNGDYNFDMVILEPPIEVGAQAIGTINLFIIEYDTYPSSYGVSITYEDLENSTKNENETLNDL